MRAVRLGSLGLVAIVLVGCGERVQTIPPGGERKSDTRGLGEQGQAVSRARLDAGQPEQLERAARRSRAGAKRLRAAQVSRWSRHATDAPEGASPLSAAAAGAAGAQQGTAARRAPRPRQAPRSAGRIQVVPNDGAGPPIVLPPGSKATITTTVVPEPQPTDSNAQRARSQPLNNAPFWRGVHDSGKAPGTVNNLQLGERGVLIQPITAYPGTSDDDRRRGVAAAAQLVDHPAWAAS